MQPCPSDQELEQFLAQKLSETERTALEEHVQECARCQDRLAGFTRESDLEQWRHHHASDSPPGQSSDEDFLRHLRDRPPDDGDPPAGASASLAVAVEECLRPAAGWPQVRGYEILHELGRGGMGVVYKALQVRLNRLVALKMILAAPAAGAEELRRFRTEAEAAAQLKHPSIVQVYEVGEHQGLPYLSLELVEGGSLAEKLAGVPQPPRQAAELLATLAEAMHHAHQRGIVHRDLKPANILLAAVVCSSSTVSNGHGPRTTDYGLPKIADFGLARFVSDNESLAPMVRNPALPGSKSTWPSVCNGPATKSGAIVGTPSYMAPEQAAGQIKKIGPATDIYALGAILYEMLTGRPPFRGEAPLDTLLQVQWMEPVPLRRLQPGVPRDLETICLTCLRKEAHRRYATAAALADDLRRFLDNRPILARPTSVWERGAKWTRRRPAAAILLAGCLLTVIGLIAGVIWHNQGLQAAQAAALVEALAKADTAEVPRLIEELAAYRSWADPLLEQLAADAASDPRQRLHASLALVGRDPEQVSYLSDRLLTARPDQLMVIRMALGGYREQVRSTLWELAEDPRRDANRRFRAACALAAYDPDSPRWSGIRGVIVNHLLTENPVYLGKWAEALAPARGALLEPLAAVFRTAERHDAKRVVTASLLADYASDRPEVLADLLLDADEQQFAILYPKLEEHRHRVLPLLHTEFSKQLRPRWHDLPLNPACKVPEPALIQRIDAAHGMLAERFALVQTMPLNDFLIVADQLRQSGYRPTRFRPYAAGEVVQVAAVWTRDGQDWATAYGLSAEALRGENARQVAKGYQPADVLGYPSADGADGPEECYAALWVKRPTDPKSAVMEVGLEKSQATTDAYAALAKDGYRRAIDSILIGVEGKALESSIWIKIPWDQEVSMCSFWGTESGYSGSNYPGELQTDVQVSKVAPPCHGPEERTRTESADRYYLAVWRSDPNFTSTEVHGLDPENHLACCRILGTQGYRPESISVAEVRTGQLLVTASVWHRPPVSENDKESLAKRQANAAVALFKLGQVDQLWPLLRHGPDPRVRTYLIHRLSSLEADSRVLVDRLVREPEVSIRRALLLCLGDFDEQALPLRERAGLMPKLLHWFRNDADPGIHAASEWLLRQWKQNQPLQEMDRELAQGGGGRGAERGNTATTSIQRDASDAPGERQDGGIEKPTWYVNGQGQTLVVLPGPVEFLMGSPATEPQRFTNEIQHPERIAHSFAIATKEVTVEQFRRFTRSHPGIKHSYSPRFSPEPDTPQTSVSWYAAAAYCNWLSEQERLPPSEWCYEPNQDGKYEEGMRLAPDWSKRIGYRLPSEAEWEYACRAGARTSRFYGESDELLGKYVWYAANAQERSWPVGNLKPNDWGLFDMLGNTFEWCQDRDEWYGNRKGKTTIEQELANLLVRDKQSRILRGGAYGKQPRNLRCADRFRMAPPDAYSDIGFRVARTHRR